MLILDSILGLQTEMCVQSQDRKKIDLMMQFEGGAIVLDLFVFFASILPSDDSLQHFFVKRVNLRSVLDVFFTRLLVIPSLILAPWLLTKTSSKRVQIVGFAGCAVANLILALFLKPLRDIKILFFTLHLGFFFVCVCG